MLLLTLAAGCSGGPEQAPATTPSATTTGPPVDGAVDYEDPGAVCGAFARAVYVRDTTVDRSPADSYLRTRPVVEDALYRSALAQLHTGRGDPRWTEWRNHRARTQVTVRPFVGDDQVDGDDTAERSVQATVVPVGRDGWRGPAENLSVACTLRRTGGRWLVSDYAVSTS